MNLSRQVDERVALRQQNDALLDELQEMQDRLTTYELAQRARKQTIHAAERQIRRWKDSFQAAQHSYARVCERLASTEVERDLAVLQANDEGNRADEAERRAETMRRAFEQAMEQADRLAFALRFFGGDPEGVMEAS